MGLKVSCTQGTTVEREREKGDMKEKGGAPERDLGGGVGANTLI